MVGKQLVTIQRGFQFLAGMEGVGLKHVVDPVFESLSHAVGLWMRRRGQTVFDAKVRGEQVELVFACRGAFAQTEETVGKFLSVIGPNRPDPDGAGPF